MDRRPPESQSSTSSSRLMKVPLSLKMRLSSFVCLTFHQAKSYIPVDGVKIAVTMTWIIERQNDNGSFSEPPNGRVIHTDMQGGSSNGVPLTAYVFSALLVNQDNQVINKTLLDSSISMAQFYLEQQLDFISDSYSLCIISYALVLAKSSKANLAVSKRDKLATVENGLKHWEKIESVVAAEKGSFIPPYQQSSAIDIEMTAYALLTYCLRKDANGAVPLVKWLITQRNPTGGFVSTQDTVMAIQALACFAQMIYGPLSSFNLHVNASIGLENHAFDPITQHNMQTLQIWEPATTTGIVRINATGIGSAITQFNVFYNVHKLNGSNSFSLTTETTVKDGGKTVVVKTCTRWTRKDVKCGMALITVELLSGYELLSVEEVGKISGLMEKVEPKPGAVNIYFSTIDNVGVCISVNMTRTVEVYNPMKASIKCLDYYNPGNSITGTYPE